MSREDAVTTPHGCHYCGEPKRGHASRWWGPPAHPDGPGFHAWTPPTQEQIKARMFARQVQKLRHLVESLKRKKASLVRERDQHRSLRDRLAERLSAHAYCDEHPLSSPAGDCPFCGDRDAYLAHVKAGGHDFRPPGDSDAVNVFDLLTRQSDQPYGPAATT